MMTRKDYEVIADTIKSHQQHCYIQADDAGRAALRDLAETLCMRLQYGNPRFDAERFLRACTYEPK